MHCEWSFKYISLYINLESHSKELQRENEVMENELEESRKQKVIIEKECADIKLQFNKIKLILEQKEYARNRRKNTATTFEMINDSSSSARYRRRAETKNLLEYIHGGCIGSIFGAWDYLCKYADENQMEKFCVSYRRGKFLEKLYGKFSDHQQKSDSNMKQALATKYASHLSRRKYNFLCKIQKSAFDTKNQRWTSKHIMYDEYKINLKVPALVSHETIEKFTKTLDIGEIHIIPGYAGVARTVTALITMICDLHIKVDALRKNLIWFNNNINHFVAQFSDDGAPESSETTMSIGSLTLWNLGMFIV